jgi:hypothetical protein
MTTDDAQVPRPRLPRKGGASSNGGPRHATWIALVGMMVIVTGLIGLMAMVMPEIQVILLLVGAFTIVFGGHYIVWGYWLERSLSRERREQPIDFWRRAAPPEPNPPESGD